MNFVSKLKHLKSIPLKNCAGFHTSSASFQHRGMVKLKKLQADYQLEDGRPIWLKSGLCDRLLYSSTVILSYVGTVWSIVTIYHLAKPNSWRTEC